MAGQHQAARGRDYLRAIAAGGVGGGGGGDASAALQQEQIDKMIAAPATEAAQTTTNAHLTNIEASNAPLLLGFGEVQASPTANTLLARLKDLLTGITLAAGSAIMGKVKIVDAAGTDLDWIGVAHDGVGTSLNPVVTGGYAYATLPTAVSTDGDVVRAWHTLNGAYVNVTYGGFAAHDAAGAAVNPLPIAYASAAAPSNVSTDGDIVKPWHLLNGAQAVNITAAGALIPGDATLGLTVKPLGNIAHDTADSGNPVKVGGRAISAEITPITAADRADFLTDLVGKHIVLPYANPENFVSGAITTAMTGTTTTSLIASPGGALRNYITQITVSNAHATVSTDVIIQDGSGGTTLYTIPAAAVYGGAVLTFPVPLRQPTVATAIYCANVTTGASTKVSASGYKGV